MSQAPCWLTSFVDAVCRAIQFVDGDAPLGCHHFHDAEGWEISLFTATTEIVGGPKDGAWIPEPIVFSVSDILKAFDEVHDIVWQGGRMNAEDELGTHLSLHGIVDGHRVWLRLLEQAPRQFSPGRILYHSTGKVAGGWT